MGVVLVQGWPLAHHVFAGNRQDAKTVPDVLEDLEQRFRIRRLIFVGDRGMMTRKNLDVLREHELHRPALFEYVDRTLQPTE